MKFRIIWLGPDDEPDRHLAVPEAGVSPQSSSQADVYIAQEGTMIRRQQLRSGQTRVIPICNFVARIVRDIIWDDELEARREFGVEAEVAGQKQRFVVPAADFNRMRWVPRQLGPRAIICPGQLQHVCAAIQSLSGTIRSERVFTHLGWRKQSSDWMFLQAERAVGAQGTCDDWQVHVPAALRHYQMPPCVDRAATIAAIRSSLDFLSVAPDRISFPLLAAVYRAPLGPVDFSLFLTGRTGTFKTALAAVCQQHFGAAMDASRLPASFASTANALEEICFCAKDVLVVVDDFAPTGGTGDKELHGLAERLFRSVGNHQGRSRMAGQRKVSASHPPRSLLLATGEEVPRGHSLRARLLIVEVTPGEVDRGRLGHCQRAALNGQLAAAMGGYLTWIGGRYEEVQRIVVNRVHELRSRVLEEGTPVHARLPTTIAELQSGWEIWLQFALDLGATTSAEKAQLESRSWRELNQLAVVQGLHQQASDPALRFVSLLQVALATGHAHIADRSGRAPDAPEQWGWRRDQDARRWVPRGTRIGWLKGNDLFLEPMVSYEVAQQIAGVRPIPISAQTLRQRLREHDLLASVDVGREMLLVRRTLEGTSKQVLHFKAKDLLKLAAAPV